MAEATAEGMRAIGAELRNASGTRINPATEDTLSLLHLHFEDQQATGTLGALNDAVTFSGLSARPNVVFQVEGTLLGKIIFEAIVDGGVTWTPIYAFLAGTGQTKTEYTNPASGTIYRCSTAGFTSVRIRCSAYTSGSVNVYSIASFSTSGVFINFPLPQGGNLIGVVNLADVAGTTIEPLQISDNLEGLGKTSIGTTATAIAFSGVTKSIIIAADPANTGTLYIGKSNVTSAGANALTYIDPGESVTIAYDDAANAVYIVASVAGQNYWAGALIA